MTPPKTCQDNLLHLLAGVLYTGLTAREVREAGSGNSSATWPTSTDMWYRCCGGGHKAYLRRKMTRRARGLLLAPALVPALLLTTVAARPPAPPPALPVVTTDPLLNHAERVALRVLAADQDGRVHRAAPFYTMPWLRDSYAWGMIPDDAGTLSTYATGELRYWLHHQQPFGGWVSFQYSGWYDETAIMIAAVLDAYRLTGDRGMVRRALPALRRGWAWLRGATDSRHGSRCLLWVTLRPTGPH